LTARDLCRSGAETMAAAVRTGETSCVELTEAALAIAAETEPRHHAFATLGAEHALETAALRDAELRSSGPRGPLHGVPISFKDSISTTFLPTEAGSAALRGWLPGEDAAVVVRAHEAGAVTIGKTVMHEFGFGQNRIPTRSALSDTMFPGGSSSGSAASVALGSSGLSVGTDAGGSSRIPAAYNGIVGLKPTFGRVSRHGVVRCSSSLDHMGLLTRTVADSALLLGVLSGHDRRDPATSARSPWPAGEAAARHLRVGIVEDLNRGDADTERVLAETADRLRDAGVEVVAMSPLPMAAMAAATGCILSAEGGASHRDLLAARGADYDPATRTVIQAGLMTSPAAYRHALAERVRLQAVVRGAYDGAGIDALLCPTAPQHAIDNDIAETVSDPADPDSLDQMVRTTTFANLLGLPGLSIPAGRAADGLPVSVQFVGRPFAESDLFALGALIEMKDAVPC